jgi:hypothetical protein
MKTVKTNNELLRIEHKQCERRVRQQGLPQMKVDYPCCANFTCKRTSRM